MLNVRLRRCARVIEARRSTGVFSCLSSNVLGLLPFPRLASETRVPLLCGLQRVVDVFLHGSAVKLRLPRNSSVGAEPAIK